jgi:hypothetical protein
MSSATTTGAGGKEDAQGASWTTEALKQRLEDAAELRGTQTSRRTAAGAGPWETEELQREEATELVMRVVEDTGVIGMSLLAVESLAKTLN